MKHGAWVMGASVVLVCAAARGSVDAIAVTWVGEVFAFDFDAGSRWLLNDRPGVPQWNSLARAPDGTIWTQGNGYLWTIDPLTGAAEVRDPLDLDVRGMAFTPEGLLYMFVKASLGGDLCRMDLGTGVLDDLGRISVPSQSLAAGPDGALYIRTMYRDPGLIRIDPHTLEEEDVFSGTEHVDFVQGLEFGPDGRLYESNTYGIFAIDLISGGESFVALLPSGDVRGIAILPTPGAGAVFLTLAPCLARRRRRDDATAH